MLKVSSPVGDLSGRFSATAPVVTEIGGALAEEWGELAEAASEPNAYAEGWFVASALAHLRNGEQVRLAQVRDAAGTLIGILPLTTARQYGRVPVATVTNWVHLQCYCGMPLIRAGDETAFWTALLDLLDRSSWASGFLSMRLLCAGGPVLDGLDRAAKASGRRLHIGQHYERAALIGSDDPETYLENTIRTKKRKELRRQAKRLGELGAVAFERLGAGEPIDEWCGQYLALEAAGWKGEGGTALAAGGELERFFRETTASAHALGKLDMLRLVLDGKPIAMLVNLRTPPAVWSYKITYDESLARYSPGVLVILEATAQILRDPAIGWADSCAKPDHPMIDSLWGERLSIVHVSVSLKGPLRRFEYSLCRGVDKLGALARRNGARNDD